jgi:nitroreductase
MTDSTQTTTNSKIINALKWRYATKRFDPTKKISANDLNTLQDALRLAPSSFGLQPWHFMLVTNPELRKELQAHSWNQPQLVEASHIVVITSLKTIDQGIIDRFIKTTAETRGITPSDLASYQQMIEGFVARLNQTGGLEAWTARQAYIALGFLLSSAALLSIDSCPIEGIDPAQYNRILGLENTPYATRVVCALGYRAENDAYAQAKKVRFGQEDVFSFRS